MDRFKLLHFTNPQPLAIIKKTEMRYLLILFIGLLLISNSSCQENDGKVKIFVSWPGASYPPGYIWEKGEAKPTGVEPKLIERILEIAGYEYTFIDDYEYNENGDVRLDVITDGKADITIRSITITEDRKQKVNFSEPYYYDGASALVLENNGIESKDDFQNKKVFAFDFTTAYDWAIGNLKESEIVTYEDFSRNQRPEQLLLEGKIDVYLGDRTYLKTFLNKSPKFKLLDETYTREPFGIAVDKDQPQLLNDINNAIEQLRSTGELEIITSEFKK
jgi:ABC-type amino acid transport substrate-binding protein